MNELLSDKRVTKYGIGFICSALLTLASYYIVSRELVTGKQLGFLLAALAGTQLIVQLLLFLHVNEEPKPRFNALALFYTTITIFAIVAGSIWIMHNLHYNMKPVNPDTDKAIIEDEGYEDR